MLLCSFALTDDNLAEVPSSGSSIQYTDEIQISCSLTDDHFCFYQLGQTNLISGSTDPTDPVFVESRKK